MRFAGMIGFSKPVEKAPDVMEDVITEVEYMGDVVQRTEAFRTAQSVLPEYRLTTSVSVLADEHLTGNYRAIRYVTYLGDRWEVASAVMQYPRLVLYLGEPYHGPAPE